MACASVTRFPTTFYPRRIAHVRTFGRRAALRRPPVLQPPVEAKQNPDTLPFARAALYTIAGGTVFGLAVVGAWSVAAADTSAPEEASPSCSCAQRVRIFGSLSSTYDSTVGRDEVVMGMPLLRWWLLRHAHGDVLEVASGTGSNLYWYDLGRCRVTATDASQLMLESAAKKIGRRKTWADNVELRQVDACSLADAFNGRRFDTVVDAFGLCSFEDPTLALDNMRRCCSPDGTLLFLEHGRSHYAFLNRLLDKYAARHLQKWGCSWNRDIEAIVRGAGLQISSLRRFHFGTTYLIVAHPAKANPGPS